MSGSLKLVFLFAVFFAMAVGIVLFLPAKAQAISCPSSCSLISVSGDCGNGGSNGACSSGFGGSCWSGTTQCRICSSTTTCQPSVTTCAAYGCGPQTTTCTVTSSTCGACSVLASSVNCGTTSSGTQTCTNNCGGTSSQNCSVTGTYCASGTCTNGACSAPAAPPAAPVAPTAPSSSITAPADRTWQGSAGFNVSVTDTNATWCGYWVYSDPAGGTVLWSNRVVRTCNANTPLITVGPSGNCRNESTAAKPTPCQVHAYSFNGTTESADNYRSYAIDFTAPSAPTSVTYSPNPNTTGQHTVSWSGASDNTGGSGIASYDIQRLLSTTWTTVATGITSTSWTQSPSVGPGSYMYQVRTRDAAGNVSGWSGNQNAVTVSDPDTAAPTVIVGASPASVTTTWQNTNSTMTIVCDDGTGVGCQGAADWKYYVSINQINFCSPTFTDYVGSYSASGISLSSHLWVCATAQDAAGNREFSSPVEFKIDKTAPAVDSFTVTVNNLNANGALTIAWTASDTGGYSLNHSEVWVGTDEKKADGSAGTDGVPDTWSKVDGDPDTAGTQHAVSPFTHNPAEGMYWYGIHTIDNATNCISEKGEHCGGVGSDSYDVAPLGPRTVQGPIKVVMDKTAPVTSLTSVAGDTASPYWDTTNNSSTDVVVAGEANMLCRWGTSDVAYSSMTNGCSVSGTNATCSLGSLAESASYTRYVSCRDAVGNEQTTTQNLNITFGVDWTAPTGNMTGPASVETDKSFNLTVTGNDSVAGISTLAAYYGDKWNYYACDGNPTFCSYTFTTTESTAGSKTYYGYIYEGAGNNATTSPSSITVTVEQGLTFPVGFWQRLWYADPASNDFSPASYLGKNTVGSLDMDWERGELCSSAICGGNANSRKDRIGFRAGRTLTGLTPGAYTITIGADDGIKLFVNESGNLLPPRAWGGCTSNGCSYDDNKHNVRVELGTSATIEIHYYENTGDAKITFAYSPGFTDITADFACYLSPVRCSNPPGKTWDRCLANKALDGYCYYNGTANNNDCLTTTVSSDSSTACSTGGVRRSIGACIYQNRCQVQAGQTCTDLGCVEGTPPGVTINTASDQWYPAANPTFNLTATDNVALQSIKYQIDIGDNTGNYTADQSGTAATSDGSSSLAVSGASITTNWKISTADWDGLSQGSHTIYVKAIDTSSNCRGCDGSKSFTIKKDSVAPTITIGGIKRNSDGVSLGTLGGQWLRGGIYEVSVSVTDNVGSSGVDTDYRPITIRSKGLDNDWYTADDKIYSTTRTADNKFNVWVGPGGADDCVTQGLDKCMVEVSARDSVQNIGTITSPTFHIDYTPPSAQ